MGGNKVVIKLSFSFSLLILHSSSVTSHSPLRLTLSPFPLLGPFPTRSNRRTRALLLSQHLPIPAPPRTRSDRSFLRRFGRTCLSDQLLQQPRDLFGGLVERRLARAAQYRSRATQSRGRRRNVSIAAHFASIIKTLPADINDSA